MSQRTVYTCDVCRKDMSAGELSKVEITGSCSAIIRKNVEPKKYSCQEWKWDVCNHCLKKVLRELK